MNDRRESDPSRSLKRIEVRLQSPEQRLTAPVISVSSGGVNPLEFENREPWPCRHPPASAILGDCVNFDAESVPPDDFHDSVSAPRSRSGLG